jgi:hypothetical protein
MSDAIGKGVVLLGAMLIGASLFIMAERQHWGVRPMCTVDSTLYESVAR